MNGSGRQRLSYENYLPHSQVVKASAFDADMRRFKSGCGCQAMTTGSPVTIDLEKRQVVAAMRKRCPDLGDFILRELADAAIETINRIRKPPE